MNDHFGLHAKEKKEENRSIVIIIIVRVFVYASSYLYILCVECRLREILSFAVFVVAIADNVRNVLYERKK